MKLKVRTLMESAEQLASILAIPYKAVTAYKIGRNARKIRSELREVDQVQNELFRKYGEQQPDGRYMVKPEHIEVFTAEREELLEQVVDVDIRTMSVEDLAGKEVPSRVFDVLWYFFDEELEEAIDATAVEQETPES